MSLVKGKYYFYLTQYILKFGTNGFINLENKTYKSYHQWEGITPTDFEPATQSQIRHYEACKKANKFIPLKEVNFNLGWIW